MAKATRTIAGDSAVITVNGATITIKRDRKNGRRLRVEVVAKLGEPIRINVGQPHSTIKQP
jgi:hypothetical protein